ncbi:probable calcium-binding protein CML44 [Diospyros lotus]|uniref:probable calcium-binding protein CML44 n=1 Tax=Diospyros lotus TaxID=55363 RepID=UPI00224EA2FE|nr:probable calcium-binding protein CML44 [Diospyros lotus]
MSALNSDDLNRIFDRLDLDGDGFVSIDELKWLLERIGVHACLEELAPLVGQAKLDRIDFVLFYDSIIIRRSSDEEEDEGAGEEEDDGVESDLAKAFKVYDLNGDGYISCEELQSVLSRLGLWNEHCGKDCRSMISKFDTNSDGVLDFEEFKNMMFLS